MSKERTFLSFTRKYSLIEFVEELNKVLRDLEGHPDYNRLAPILITWGQRANLLREEDGSYPSDIFISFQQDSIDGMGRMVIQYSASTTA